MLAAPHGLNADGENELPLLRSLAFDAHSCIMVRIQRDQPYIRLWRVVVDNHRQLNAGSASCRYVVLKSSDRPPSGSW
jgi:hypothetical protein